jgi:hypothetical protein
LEGDAARRLLQPSQSVLRNNFPRLDGMFVSCLVVDVVKGLRIRLNVSMLDVFNTRLSRVQGPVSRLTLCHIVRIEAQPNLHQTRDKTLSSQLRHMHAELRRDFSYVGIGILWLNMHSG